MARRRNRGQIPSELGWLVDTLDDHEERLDGLATPSGTQFAGTTADMQRTLDYLVSLKTYAATGPSTSTGTVANDGIIHWFAVSTPVRVSNVDIATQQCLVTASLGESSQQVGGSFTEGFVGYRILDVNGTVVPGAGIGANTGRFYSNQRAGISISTGPCKHAIDPVANPGPYTIELFVGYWVATLNTTACSATFNDPSLVVQVIGDGVPS